MLRFEPPESVVAVPSDVGLVVPEHPGMRALVCRIITLILQTGSGRFQAPRAACG
jgi:hypothetical protein